MVRDFGTWWLVRSRCLRWIERGFTADWRSCWQDMEILQQVGRTLFGDIEMSLLLTVYVEAVEALLIVDYSHTVLLN